MRRVLLVEGSDSRPPREAASALSTLWGTLCDCVGVPRFDRVEPIDKGFIERLTEGEAALDEEVVRLGLGQPGDALLVAWDARPPWLGARTDVCRWRETVGLYEHLDRRQKLPAPLLAHVKARHGDLAGRSQPGQRTSPAGKLSPGALYALCMDPAFEGLFCYEKVIWEALGLKGERCVKDWPSWKSQADPKSLLDRAILAARRHAPRPDIVNRIGLDYTRKQEAWAAHFIRHFAETRPDEFGQLNVVQRLRSLL